ncbi:hypothetical protein Q3G72_021458 [Acer saccharum]|nr:hypothetical protein Q3G72_021458 [Acer saccharum]
MAEYGWSKRRAGLSNNYARNVEGGNRLDNRLKHAGVQHSGRQSFVEVVKNQQRRAQHEEDKPQDKVMSWNEKGSSEEWLNRCAVGIMKEFASTTSVNQRLGSRGFSFTSSYVGEKSILWCFKSVKERDDFMRNRSLCDDVFSSMSRWSNAIVPKSRLVWINCIGVPLSAWSLPFFMQLRKNIGNPLLVEDDTLSRKRLDRGKFLVLIPVDKSGPWKIRVVTGEASSFMVRLKEDSSPVDFRWLAGVLDLRQSYSVKDLNLLQEKGRVDPLPRKVTDDVTSS